MQLYWNKTTSSVSKKSPFTIPCLKRVEDLSLMLHKNDIKWSHQSLYKCSLKINYVEKKVKVNVNVKHQNAKFIACCY